MISLGIDAGTDAVKAVYFEGNKLLAAICHPIATCSVSEVVTACLEQAIREAGKPGVPPDCIGITGSSAAYSGLAVHYTTFRFSSALARGLGWACPDARIGLDLGASSYIAIRCQDGTLLQTQRNTICATGTGRYLVKVSQLLRMSLEEMSRISTSSKEKPLVVGSTCAVFAETEIVSLMHAKKTPAEVVAGVYMGIVTRIIPLLASLGMGAPIAVTGGVAYNSGLVSTLGKELNLPIITPDRPELIGAIGAALLAQESEKRE